MTSVNTDRATSSDIPADESPENIEERVTTNPLSNDISVCMESIGKNLAQLQEKEANGSLTPDELKKNLNEQLKLMEGLKSKMNLTPEPQEPGNNGQANNKEAEAGAPSLSLGLPALGKMMKQLMRLIKKLIALFTGKKSESNGPYEDPDVQRVLDRTLDSAKGLEGATQIAQEAIKDKAAENEGPSMDGGPGGAKPGGAKTSR